MKTKWDYSDLAKAYLKRPEYAPEVLRILFEMAGAKKGTKVCDVGAGVAHLTIPMAKKGYDVTAVEPNDSMRELGQDRTEQYDNVRWFEATGEDTGQADGEFGIVTFGSSFNVCDRQKALAEAARILTPGGWFVCMWNHRDLDDPIQKGIEEIIKANIEGYGYGTRREDQTEVIDESGLFETVYPVSGTILHTQTKKDCIEAWRSHATLQRQAGDAFPRIVEEIERFVNGQPDDIIQIPYTTRAWAARKK
ncbi:class I SAM-dependent methyltransferase [Pseudodesulfovibrio sp.]|uniref:class I SAM-dependent methyltransferase n=1 Tax=unclassified Pseudodesulfovibrio TaxID=2661612 RepID=UPI003AFFA3B1